MSLFEKAGIILEAEETVLRQGKCKGKVPKGVEYRRNRITPLGIFRVASKQKINWADVSGELILTNQRALVLANEGLVRKNVAVYNLGEIVGASVKKPMIGVPKLELILKFGNPKTEKTELEVDDAEEWGKAIRGSNS
jgi:hypothetical protein